jgi:hypothetical protein
VPVTAGGSVQKTNTSLNWRRCTACHLAGDAGRGKGTARRVIQKDKLAALNTRRGGTAETNDKERPYDVQNAKGSLRTLTTSRKQNTLPLHGPGAKARQG